MHKEGAYDDDLTRRGESEDNLRVLLTIKGHVQGVSFRKQTMKQALERNVSGWVKNLDDGSVQSCLEGAAADVRLLLDWCSHGPEEARVHSIKSELHAYTGEYDEFRIIYP